MIKVISLDSYRLQDVAASVIKVASAGLRGHDFRTLVKRAGAEFADRIRHMKFASDEVPVHLLAIGATERYGCNRNGDAFDIATCREHHPSFVKYARFYRNHVNKDPAKSYGLVKASYYNEDMARIELLGILNGSKARAEANGGLLADEELQKLAEDKPIPVSMACHVAYDVCSSCKNKARNREEYCLGVDEGGRCPGGGVRHKMAMVLDDGTQLYVENPNPRFFDISHVVKPADRIAYVLGSLKAAGSPMPGVIGGAELAESLELTPPATVLLDSHNRVQAASLLQKLAAVEKEVRAAPASMWNLVYSPHEDQPATWRVPDNVKPANVFQACVTEKVAMPIAAFAAVYRPGTSDQTVKVATALLPDIYTRLLAQGDGDKILDRLQEFSTADLSSVRAQAWVSKFASTYPLDRHRALARARVVSLYSSPPLAKRAGLLLKGPPANLADDYAVYKLATLLQLEKDQEFGLTCELAIRQNYV